MFSFSEMPTLCWISDSVRLSASICATSYFRASRWRANSICYRKDSDSMRSHP